MAGICGLVNFERGGLVSEAAVASMVSSMSNFADEQNRTIVSAGIGAGVTSRGSGMRVFENEERAVLILGEIYEPKNGNIAESVLGSYKTRSEKFLDELEGQYSVCIINKREEELIIAADRFGTYPIHYRLDDKGLVFATKIRAILGADKARAVIDNTAIYNYLVFNFIPSPQTIYEGIKKIPPGHFLIVKDGRMKLEKYWDISYRHTEPRKEAYYCEKIRSVLEEAVRRRMPAGEETDSMGAFLSGGLDSSTVSGMMRLIAGKSIKTFSAVFHESEYSEEKYIDIAAAHFNLNSHKFVIKPPDIIEGINALIEEYDEPFGNSSAIAAYYCMKSAKENGVKIMFGGDGGDENFAGYGRYVKDKIFSLYGLLPGFLRNRVIEPALFSNGFSKSSLLEKARNYVIHSKIPNPERFVRHNLFFFYERENIFTEDFLNTIDKDAPLKTLEYLFRTPDTKYELDRLMYLDTKLSLIDNDLQGKIGKIAQLLGLAVRYPMLDTRLWDLGGSIPPGMKLKGFNKKYIYKKAFMNFLPKEIILKKKHGFGLPFAVWLRSDRKVREFAEKMLLDSNMAGKRYFKKGIFEKMLNLHDNEETPYYGDMLWVFIMLEAWYRKHAGGRA